MSLNELESRRRRLLSGGLARVGAEGSSPRPLSGERRARALPLVGGGAGGGYLHADLDLLDTLLGQPTIADAGSSAGAGAGCAKRQGRDNDAEIADLMQQLAQMKETLAKTTRERNEGGALVASMAARMRALEASKCELRAQLVELDKQLLGLRRDNEELRDGREVDLARRAEEAEAENRAIKRFLADYGLVWVGDVDEGKQTSAAEEGETDGRVIAPTKVGKAGTPPAVEVNFDFLVDRLNELNELASSKQHQSQPGGPGEARTSTSKFASIHTLGRGNVRSVPLVIFEDGLLLWNGPLRPFSDPACITFLHDVMDGFFPSEFKREYPDGVVFQVTDRRRERFSPAALPRLTSQQLLNKVPEYIIKNGQILRPRQEAANALSGEAKNQGGAPSSPSRRLRLQSQQQQQLLLLPEAQPQPQPSSNPEPQHEPQPQHPLVQQQQPFQHQRIHQPLPETGLDSSNSASALTDGVHSSASRSLSLSSSSSSSSSAVATLEQAQVVVMSAAARAAPADERLCGLVVNCGAQRSLRFQVRRSEPVGDVRRLLLATCAAAAGDELASGIELRVAGGSSLRFEDDQATVEEAGWWPNQVLFARLVGPDAAAPSALQPHSPQALRSFPAGARSPLPYLLGTS